MSKLARTSSAAGLDAPTRSFQLGNMHGASGRKAWMWKLRSVEATLLPARGVAERSGTMLLSAGIHVGERRPVVVFLIVTVPESCRIRPS